MPKDECDSGNSEKPLIELLKTVLHDFSARWKVPSPNSTFVSGITRPKLKNDIANL